jgi:hypothetical protein
MTTDKDILAALHGELRPSANAANEAILNVLNGGPTVAEQAHTDAVLEALGVAPTPRTAREGELPLRRRDNLLDPVAIWAAKEAAATSTKALAEAIMRADGTKGIYLAEGEARKIADEAYAEAAKRSAYEDERYQTVARLTAALTKAYPDERKTAEAAAKPAAKTAAAPKAAPQTTPVQSVSEAKRGTRVTSVSGISGGTIEYYK